MIVAVHQPHYLPWTGYLARMAEADLFILLDDVQFERQNYQNRTMIRFEGQRRWLSVPTLHGARDERILDKVIDNHRDGKLRWGRKHFLTLEHSYRQAPFWGLYAPRLAELYERPWERLAELDQATLDFLREALDIATPLVRSSELRAEGVKSELILNLCRAVGADAFLGGLGGCRSYLDLEAFARAGVRVLWQEFAHPRYRQAGEAPFLEGLSAVDLLFNCGPESRRMLLREVAAHGERSAV